MYTKVKRDGGAMIKQITKQDLISEKINTLPEDFWNYIKNKEEDFVHCMEDMDFTLIKKFEWPKDDEFPGLDRLSFYFSKSFCYNIDAIQEMLISTEMYNIAIDCRDDYPIYEVRILKNGNENLLIFSRRVDRMVVTTDDFRFHPFQERGRETYGMEFYSEYEDSYDRYHIGGASILFKGHAKKYPYCFSKEGCLYKNDGMLVWFVNQFHDYLKSIHECYLFKDYEREYFRSEINETNNNITYPMFLNKNTLPCDLTLLDVFLYRTKDEWIRSKAPKSQQNKLTGNFNRLSFTTCACIIKGISYFNTENSRKMIAYLQKEDTILFDEKSTEESIKWYVKKQEAAEYMLYSYYNQTLLEPLKSEDVCKYKQYEDILHDYCKMVFRLKKPEFSMNYKSLKRIEKEHNNVVQQLRMEAEAETINAIHVKKRSCFNKLRKILPKNFEWIQDGTRLYKEGIEQHNCVFSYGYNIIADECAIYSAVINGRRYTIEFLYDRPSKKYRIAQMYMACNKSGPNEDKEYVERLF